MFGLSSDQEMYIPHETEEGTFFYLFLSASPHINVFEILFLFFSKTFFVNFFKDFLNNSKFVFNSGFYLFF